MPAVATRFADTAAYRTGRQGRSFSRALLRHTLSRKTRVVALFFAVVAGFFATSLPVSANDDFGYPIADPFLATIAGTPSDLQKKFPRELKLTSAHLPKLANREVPKALWYQQRLQYSWAMQDKPAPLIFTLAGTGGYHNGDTNKQLMEAFFNAGYHVVGITSPSHPEFIVSQSTTAVPGHVKSDAEDVYSVMGQIVERLKKKRLITGYALAGYSLGGTHSAFIAKLDQERKRFNFEKVLLLNPSVSLYNSISILDRMLQNIPGGVDNLNSFFAEVISRVGSLYNRSTTVEFNSDTVLLAFQADPPSDEELVAIIGTAFRLSAANLIFTADVMNDFGFIKPSRQTLKRQTDRDHYLEVALRVGFTDYFHDFLWPYYEDSFEGDRQQFAAEQSLVHLKDFLASADNIAVVTNVDEIILAAGEIDFLEDTFGDRAFIYPRGGHLGNLAFGQTQDDYIGFLTDGAKQ